MSVPLSILYLLIIDLMEFLKVWAKHNFHYIRYISVYIQPRYFYLIFRSVNGNNMNRVILHSVRPSFWKKRAFSHAPRCGSTESGCEISVPWWLILADLGKRTSVWSRDRDTGDTSEGAVCMRTLSQLSYPYAVSPCRICMPYSYTNPYACERSLRHLWWFQGVKTLWLRCCFLQINSAL